MVLTSAIPMVSGISGLWNCIVAVILLKEVTTEEGVTVRMMSDGMGIYHINNNI